MEIEVEMRDRARRKKGTRVREGTSVRGTAGEIERNEEAKKRKKMKKAKKKEGEETSGLPFEIGRHKSTLSIMRN